MSRHSARGRAWDVQRKRVLDRDGWVCSVCMKDLAGFDATVDHISPVSHNEGKKYRDDELVAMCRTCNGTKADRVLTRIAYRNARWWE